MQSNRMNWLIAASVVALLGAAVVTLRAAEASRVGMATVATRGGPTWPGNAAAGSNAKNTAGALTAAGASPARPAGSAKQHPPASAPEESATIKDDPTTAPDPSQSADNNVSFPTDI